MKIALSQYELKAKSPLGRSAGATRRGALLRFEFAEGYGYADCHPWPEFGDESLSLQLEKLRAGVLTRLTQRAQTLARLDAAFRAKKISAFSGLQIPESHALAGNSDESSLEDWAKEGFKTVKVKANSEAKGLASLTSTAKQLGLKLRIDFNAALDLKQASTIFDALCASADAIDFVEDPILYDPKSWQSLRKRFPLRLALDRDLPGDDVSTDLLVHKPAIQDHSAVVDFAEKSGTKLVVTTYLDHPLGVSSAAWVASRAADKLGGQLETCGLMSHLVYEEEPFSAALRRSGATLFPPEGTGFGFDGLLRDTHWENLS